MPEKSSRTVIHCNARMGAGESSPADEVVGHEYGFRVHRVEKNSPGEAAGLESILDYIVVANGVRLDSDDGSFVRAIQESKGKEMHLVVFNTHTLETRETTLCPADDWGGTGLLGITIRFDLAHALDKHTLHVLEVYPSSPASEAGLDSYNDYVLGVGDLLFDGPDDFGEIILLNQGRPVRLFVYSALSQSVREVMITPNEHWGGEGCMGAGVGSGYLHTLPPRRRRRDPPTPKHKVGAEAGGAEAAAAAVAVADGDGDAVPVGVAEAGGQPALAEHPVPSGAREGAAEP